MMSRLPLFRPIILTIVSSSLVLCASSALGGEKPASGGRIDVAAIYFPGYHRDMHYDAWFGEGWNEWQLLAEAPMRFPGQQLFKPQWGPFDEADPKWMERQIALAADHGITVFLFDWYWYSGVKFLHRPLEEGFLKAGNRERLKYALMWANHNWGNYFPVPIDRPMDRLLTIRHSPGDFTRVMDECIKLHFHQPNYWRVGGKPYFSIFDPWAFMQQLGGPEKTRAVLDAARKQAASAGLGQVHFAAFTGAPTASRSCARRALTARPVTTSPPAARPGCPSNRWMTTPI